MTNLNFGRTQLAIPGPSIIPDRVLQSMHRASPNIYEGELLDMVAGIVPDLKSVARTEHDVAIYIANGHGTWEAALRNVLVPGDRVLCVETGRFAAGWGDQAESFGMAVDRLDFGMQNTVDMDQLEAKLRGADYRAVLVVQTDTATSVLNDVAAMRAVIDASGSDALFMVDCIACLGCDRFEMDRWGVDVTVAASQKGLMTPAGLGFVWFGPKADAARERAKPGSYLDWRPRVKPELFYEYFNGTAPTHHLYGLRTALDMLVHEEGLDNAWARHERIARAVWAAVDGWGEGGAIRHNIADEKHRSRAVSAVETGPGEARLLRAASEEGGLVLGIGLGFGAPSSEGFDSHFRIGHMGHQNVPMTMGALGGIEVAMKRAGVSHGDGLSAAARVLAEG